MNGRASACFVAATTHIGGGSSGMMLGGFSDEARRPRAASKLCYKVAHIVAGVDNYVLRGMPKCAIRE